MDYASESLAFLSLIVALVAALAGPIVTFIVARTQLRIQRNQFDQQLTQFGQQLSEQRLQAKQQVISPMRQAWINTLRETVAEVLSIASVLHLQDSPITSTERKQLAAQESKLELLINPSEADHRVLRDALRSVVNSISCNHPHEFHIGHKRAVELAQSVLKQEWEATKRGET